MRLLIADCVTAETCAAREKLPVFATAKNSLSWSSDI
jgi:hypothetical protein